MGLLKIPSSLMSTPVTIVIGTGQDDYGNTTNLTVTGMCRLEEKAQQRIDAEKRLVTLAGCIYLGGDIVPNLPVIESGTVTIDNRSWNIDSAERKRDMAGNVHHTKLYLR